MAQSLLGKYVHDPDRRKSGQQPRTSYADMVVNNSPTVKQHPGDQRSAEKMAPEARGTTVSTCLSPLPPPGIADPSDPDHREPSLQDILTAVHTYGSSITKLSTEVRSMKEVILQIRHDMQKVRESTTALEGSRTD